MAGSRLSAFTQAVATQDSAKVEYHSSDEYEKFEITVPRAARSAVPDRAPAEVSLSLIHI